MRRSWRSRGHLSRRASQSRCSRASYPHRWSSFIMVTTGSSTCAFILRPKSLDPHHEHLAHGKSFDSCAKAKLRAGSHRSARNYVELDCNHYKEARLRFGFACFFTGGAPQEHRRSRLPSHASDLVLCARVAGPFSRLTLSQPMIKGALVAYNSSCARWYAAHGWAWSL